MPTPRTADTSPSEPIRSLRNRRVVEAGRLHRARDRRRLGLTLLEGPNVVREAVRAGVTLVDLFALPDDEHLAEWPRPTIVNEAVMSKLAPTENPRGPLAVAEIPGWTPLPTDHDVIVLWEVADPGNVGTMIRTAAAFRLAVALSPGCADPWSPKAIRAGAGGHFRLVGLASIDDPSDLSGHRLAATVARGGVPPEDLGDGPWAVMVGSEAHGLDPSVVASCERRVTIPMPGGTESLNVATAAAILAYQLSRADQRHH